MRQWLIVMLVLSFAGLARAEEPTTAPATQPVTPFTVDAPAREWFSDLASPEDARREVARINLMGLSRDDLPRLQALVDKCRPVAAAQAAALHEIVMQVFLSGEPYAPADPPAGFLGLSWLGETNYEVIPRLGVPVLHRYPGFPSFRMLRDGDLILGVFINPKESLQQLPNMPTQNREALVQVVRTAGPNRTVVLDILRQGQEVRVPLQLLPRPPVQDAVDSNAFFGPRLQKAEEYWRSHFMPLLRGGVS